MRERVCVYSLFGFEFFDGGGVSIIVPLQPPSPCLSVLFWGLFFFLLLLFCLFFNIFLIYMYVEPFPLFLLVLYHLYP